MSHPVLVVADIHGNLEALKAVLKDAAGLYEDIWVLGDIAGYGPDPGPCLDMLWRRKALMVAGNHDRAACSQVGIEDFNPEARAAVELHRIALSADQRDVLAALPEMLVRRSITLVHGRPDNPIWGYVLSDSAAAGVLRTAETSLTLSGHSHLVNLWAYDPNLGARSRPVAYDEEYSYSGVPHLANPGSVGQSRDGDVSARYLIVNPDRKTLLFRRCDWRRKATRRKMMMRGYPASLIDRMAPAG